MPPKRKATSQKSKDNPVIIPDIEPEAPEDFVDKKPRSKRGAAKKDVVDEASSAEPEEVVEKKRRKGPTKTKDVVEDVAPVPEEVVEKKGRKGPTKAKVEEAASSVPEEVEKKSRKGGTTKTKAAVKESVQEEPKKSARGKAVPAKVEDEEEENTTDIKKSSRSARGKKKEAEVEANGTEHEEKRANRKKKADSEPVSEEPKIKGRKKATKEKEDEKEEKPSSSAKTAKTAATKKKVTKDDKKAEKEDKIPLNKTNTDWDSIDFTCSKRNAEGMSHNLIISCWNIGGLKSWVKKDCLKFLEYETPDILCIQETKCSEEKLPDEIKDLKLYKQYWCSSEKEGYAGVGLLTIKEPISVAYGIDVPELDEDGRCITAEFKEFYLICVYVPNAGRKLVTLPKRLEWNEAFKSYVKTLDAKKPVIICGDMNVAHDEIDLARPQNNTKNAGFTPEEREGMTEFLGNGYVDTFRKLYPDKADVYTFWTYMANARAKNVGWRLDYFIVSKRIMNKVCDNIIRTEVVGSDHCPITLFININTEGPRSISQ